jgi:hypothetical protein
MCIYKSAHIENRKYITKYMYLNSYEKLSSDGHLLWWQVDLMGTKFLEHNVKPIQTHLHMM